MEKFVSQIKEKKSFDHLKLKLTSGKKLELVKSSAPSSLNFVFDSLISNENNGDNDFADNEKEIRK